MVFSRCAQLLVFCTGPAEFFHHWLINLQKHKWFEYDFSPSLGLEHDSKREQNFLKLKPLLAQPLKDLGMISQILVRLRLLCLGHRTS